MPHTHRHIAIQIAPFSIHFIRLDVDLAIRVYRELKDAAMVLALLEIQSIGTQLHTPRINNTHKHTEDKHLLAGHVCLLTGDYQRAQALFATSSNPLMALQMRRDLLHWSVSALLCLCCRVGTHNH